MRRAFSLIELLVVIAIIAILASMLLPAVGMVRDSANGSKCASNSRQLVIAAIAYANENEGILPGSGYGQNYYHWTYSMAPYVEAQYAWGSSANNAIKVYQCPVNNPLLITPDPGWPANYGTGYALGQFCSVKPNASGQAGYWRDNKMPAQLSMTWLKHKSEWWLWGELQPSYSWWPVLGTTTGDIANGAAFPHRGRMTLNHADGHVATVDRRSYDIWCDWDLANLP